MRKLWTVLSVIAVANLLAFAGFVGWLRQTDRLNMERVRAVRAMLSKTVVQEQAEVSAAEKASEEERVKAEQERQASKPPLTAAERLSARVEATELDRQRAERLKREIADLQRQLSDDRLSLSRERTEFEAEKKAFASSIASVSTEAEEAQFQKTLGVLQAQKPKDAVILLKQMLAAPAAAFEAVRTGGGGAAAPSGSAESEAAAQRTALVTNYLDAMTDKKRSLIIAELTKSDPRLAAELLEELRTRGNFARVP